MKSESSLVTTAVLSRALGISASRIVALKSEGLPFTVTPQGHRFDLHGSMRWYVTRKAESQRKSQPAESDGAPLSPVDTARLRKIEVAVKSAELELARRQGEVVSIETVVTTVAAHISSAWSRLLSLPFKLAPVLAMEDSAAEYQKLLESAIYEVLTGLGSGGFGMRGERLKAR